MHLNPLNALRITGNAAPQCRTPLTGYVLNGIFRSASFCFQKNLGPGTHLPVITTQPYPHCLQNGGGSILLLSPRPRRRLPKVANESEKLPSSPRGHMANRAPNLPHLVRMAGRSSTPTPPLGEPHARQVVPSSARDYRKACCHYIFRIWRSSAKWHSKHPEQLWQWKPGPHQQHLCP